MRPSRVQTKTAVGLLGVVLALAACGRVEGPNTVVTAGSAPAALPWGRSFLSTDVTENGVRKELIPGSRILIEFKDDRRVIASAGCNSGGGGAWDAGGRLVITDVMTTEIGCEPIVRHTQDEWLGAFLSSKPRWNLQGTTLTLDNGSARVLLEDRKVSRPDRALRGSRWVVNTIIEAGGASSIPAGVEAYLEFVDDQRVIGSSGCNSLSGGAAVDEANAAITFAEIRGTKMGCDQARMRVEQAVHQALRGRVGFKIDGDKLVLTGPAGHGLHLRAAR
ncbi:MAG: META domain-containing protein [Mycobacteriales bacterium]